MDWKCAYMPGDLVSGADRLELDEQKRPCIHVIIRHDVKYAAVLLTIEDAQALIDHIAGLIAGPLGKLALAAAKKEKG